MLKTYVVTGLLSWQKGIEYRFGVLYIILEALLPTMAMVLLWTSIYEDGGMIAGYTLNQMITYLIISRLIHYLIWYPMDWKMHEAVNQGVLSGLLVKPVDVQGYYFSDMLGNRIVNLALGIVPLGIVGLIMKDYLVVNSDVSIMLLGVVSLIMACILAFLFSWVIGCYSFWTQNLIGILFLKETIVMILAGGFFPVDILPHHIYQIIQWTPFPYLAYFPIKLLTNQMEPSMMTQGLIVQGIWILLFFILGRLLWRSGIKVYTEAGG